MRIGEKRINVHFQWERDSSRSYTYTTSIIRTLYGKPLTLHLMYSLICPRNLNISCFDEKAKGGRGGVWVEYSTMWKSFLKTNKR